MPDDRLLAQPSLLKWVCFCRHDTLPQPSTMPMPRRRSSITVHIETSRTRHVTRAVSPYDPHPELLMVGLWEDLQHLLASYS